MNNCFVRISKSMVLQAILVTVVVCAILIMCGSRAQAADVPDMENAQQLNLGNLGVTEKEASSSQEYYYKTYKFTTTGNDSYYKVTLKNMNIRKNLSFFLYDASGIKIDDFDRTYISKTNEKSKYDKLDKSSTYYVLVKFNADKGKYSGDYNITVEEIIDDAGNDSAHAVSKTPGAIEGTIEVEDDADYYKITARRSGTHTVTIINPNSSNSIKYEILNNNGVKESDGTVYKNSSKEESIDVQAGKIFYIKIRSSSDNLKYKITIKEPPSADERAASNVIGMINALPVTVGIDDAGNVKTARDAYNALTDSQKKLVDANTLKKLVDAEAAVAKAAAEKAAADKAAKEKEAKEKADAENETAARAKVRKVKVNVATVSNKTIAKAIKKAGGSKKYVTCFVLGKKVKTIKAKAFAKYKKAKSLVVKTKKLTKKRVKAALKGSKIKKIKVKVGNKKMNKKFIKKYKKIFTKKNAGKKVKVV